VAPSVFVSLSGRKLKNNYLEQEKNHSKQQNDKAWMRYHKPTSSLTTRGKTCMTPSQAIVRSTIRVRIHMKDEELDANRPIWLIPAR